MDAVEAVLVEINAKHKDLFAGLTSKFAEDKEVPAKLQDYTVMLWSNAGTSIGFSHEVPKHIANEARRRFSTKVAG